MIHVDYVIDDVKMKGTVFGIFKTFFCVGGSTYDYKNSIRNSK